MDDPAVLHVLYLGSPNCPHCGAGPEFHEVKNYDALFHDGDVVCTRCREKVRDYDAG